MELRDYAVFSLYFTGENVRLVMPKLPASFTGTGDLFSASLLAWSDLELKVFTSSLLVQVQWNPLSGHPHPSITDAC